MSTLQIIDLRASVETKEGRKQILNGVNLTIESGQTHVKGCSAFLVGWF